MIIVPLVVLVGSLHVWIHRTSMADELVHETARIMATTADWDSGRSLVDDLEGRLEARLSSTSGGCPAEGGCVEVEAIAVPSHGSTVSVEVAIWMPALIVPFIGEVSGLWWTATHSEPIDPYRNPP